MYISYSYLTRQVGPVVICFVRLMTRLMTDPLSKYDLHSQFDLYQRSIGPIIEAGIVKLSLAVSRIGCDWLLCSYWHYTNHTNIPCN